MQYACCMGDWISTEAAIVLVMFVACPAALLGAFVLPSPQKMYYRTVHTLLASSTLLFVSGSVYYAFGSLSADWAALMMCSSLLLFAAALWLGRAGWEDRGRGDDNRPDGPGPAGGTDGIDWDGFDAHRQHWENTPAAS